MTRGTFPARSSAVCPRCLVRWQPGELLKSRGMVGQPLTTNPKLIGFGITHSDCPGPQRREPLDPYPPGIAPEDVARENRPPELLSKLFPSREPTAEPPVPRARRPHQEDELRHRQIAGPCYFCRDYPGFFYGPDDIVICPQCILQSHDLRVVGPLLDASLSESLEYMGSAKWKAHIDKIQRSLYAGDA